MKRVKAILLVMLALLVLILLTATCLGLFSKRRPEKNTIGVALTKKETPLKIKNNHPRNTNNIGRQKAASQSVFLIDNYARQHQLLSEIVDLEDDVSGKCTMLSYDENIMYGEWTQECVVGYRILLQFIIGAQVELSDEYLGIAKVYLEGTKFYIAENEESGQCFSYLTMKERKEISDTEIEAFGAEVDKKGKIHSCEAKLSGYLMDAIDAYSMAGELYEKLILGDEYYSLKKDREERHKEDMKRLSNLPTINWEALEKE